MLEVKWFVIWAFHVMINLEKSTPSTVNLIVKLLGYLKSRWCVAIGSLNSILCLAVHQMSTTQSSELDVISDHYAGTLNPQIVTCLSSLNFFQWFKISFEIMPPVERLPTPSKFKCTKRIDLCDEIGNLLTTISVQSTMRFVVVTCKLI